MHNICIFLSQDGKSLKIFKRQNFTKPYEAVTHPENLKNFLFLQNNGDLLNILTWIFENSNPESNLEALRKLKKFFLELTQSYDINVIIPNFIFVHEHNPIHPDHTALKETLSSTNFSGLKKISYLPMHQDTLEDLITFIEEHVLDIFTNDKRESFIHGFKYQNLSWLNFRWVKQYFGAENDQQAFEEGKAVAKLRF